MKIDVGKLVPTKENTFEEEVVFDEEKFHLLPPLLEVKKLVAKAKVPLPVRLIMESGDIYSNVSAAPISRSGILP